MSQQIGHFDIPNSPITKGVQKIKRGPVARPQKVVIYGPEGVGKSTLASKFPNPLFVDVEGSTDQLDVDRIDISQYAGTNDYEKVLEFLNEFAEDQMGYKTLIIDTIDWLELKMQQKICQDGRHTSIEDFGYGKGYTHLSEEMFRILNSLSYFLEVGVNVVLVGHSIQAKCELPDQRGQFDQWTLDLHKKVCPIVKEWADMMLFINWETKLVDNDGKDNKKAVGGRVGKIYTTHSATFDAKNRHGLADVLPLDYASIAHVFNGNAPAVAAVASKVVPASERIKNAPADAPAQEIAAIHKDVEVEQENALRERCDNGEKYLATNKVKGYTTDKQLRAIRYKIGQAEQTTGMTISQLERYLAHLTEIADTIAVAA